MISDCRYIKTNGIFRQELAVESFKEVVKGIRNTRNSMNVPQNRKTHLYIVGKDEKICQMYEKSSRSFY